jgi:oligo-1,6-glucosidase
MISLKSKVKDIYAHPVGRDLIDKALLQFNKPTWLVTNPVLSNLRLSAIQKILRRVAPDIINTIIELLNSEPDTPLQTRKPLESETKAWWKEAVFYQIYPRSFSTNGLRGIIGKLDYLREMGVDAVWLSPVYDSPNDDNGYDIRDYYAILREFGGMDDMDALIRGLHERGMKLVMDMVVNHTSDEHKWFQEALRDEASPYRDYYFFRKSKDKPPNNWNSVFGGPAWNYYPEADAWALHLFTKKQMDLNWENPALREDIFKMARWWLEKGVDGFRLDVINFISKAPNLPDGDEFIGSVGFTGIERYYYGPRLHEYLRQLRASAFGPYKAFSVGETPLVGIQQGRLLTDDYRHELDLIFSFDHLENPGHLRFDEYVYDLSYLKQFYIKHLNADMGYGWNTLFFNNHDNPRMVSKINPSGDYARPLAKLLAVYQLALRGTPFFYQGDEYGARNARFASMDEIQDIESRNLYAELEAKVGADAAFKRILAGTRDHARLPFDWEEIEKQRKEESSVWNWHHRLIALRKKTPAFVYGELVFINPKDVKRFAFIRRTRDDCLFVETNLTKNKQPSRGAKYLKDAKLLMCNYEDSPPARAALRSYEARIYKMDKNILTTNHTNS